MADVLLPQLGETVTEGTITRWFFGVGETVPADAPLYEVSTEKVDSEVPSPLGGVLVEIIAPEGATVAVGATLCRIETDGPFSTSPTSTVVGDAPADAAGATAAAGTPAPLHWPPPLPPSPTTHRPMQLVLRRRPARRRHRLALVVRLRPEK